MPANERQVGGVHYKRQHIQHWDYVLSNRVPYMEAQILKYISRHRFKNGVEDLKKAQHFIEKLIEVGATIKSSLIVASVAGREEIAFNEWVWGLEASASGPEIDCMRFVRFWAEGAGVERLIRAGAMLQQIILDAELGTDDGSAPVANGYVNQDR